MMALDCTHDVQSTLAASHYGQKVVREYFMNEFRESLLNLNG